MPVLVVTKTEITAYNYLETRNIRVESGKSLI